METLLFIANLSPTVGDLFNELSKSFSVKLVPYDWTQISKIIETTSPTKAVIYVKDLSQDETSSLHTFLQDSEKSEMPLLCIGSKDEIKKHIGSWGGNFIRIILTPTTISSILESIKNAFFPDTFKLETNQKHILVFDDNIVYLHTVTNILKEKYKVSSVKSGTAAITFLVSHKPDLILLDYSMPGLTGPQLFKMIRAEESTKQIPIIFLTGVSSKEQVQTVMSLKPDGYILKDCSASELTSRIEAFFES